MSSSKLKNRGEKGGIIVLIAFLIVPIIYMIALAIDTLNISAAKERSDYYSRYAILSALEAYYASTETDEELKLAAAKNRAAQVLSSNKMLSNGASSGDFHLSFETGTGASLEPGSYRFAQDPEDPDSPPCRGNNCFTPFARITDIGTAGTVNAFRITGTLYPELKTYFAQVINPSYAKFGTSVFSVASIIPRHTCFLIDLSRSMTEDSHKERQICPGTNTNNQLDTPEKGYSTYAAYYLSADNGANVDTPPYDANWSFIAQGQGPTCSTPAAPLPYLRSSGGHPGRPELASNPNVHYVDDYRLKAVMNDEDFNRNRATFEGLHPDPNLAENVRFRVGNTRPFYRVDFREAGGGGPQPLRGVLDGVRSAIASFRERKVAGDKACVIFFDSGNIPWYRIITPTSDFDYIDSVLDYTGSEVVANDNPASIAAGIDITGAVGRERAVRHGIIPFVNSKSDLLIALAEGAQQLADATSANSPSNDSLVLFSDGLANCTHGPGGAVCNQFSAQYNGAWSEINSNLVPSLRSANIAVHVFPVGATIGPHTILQPRSATDSTCMSDKEIRIAGQNNAASGWGTSERGWLNVYNNPYTVVTDQILPYEWGNAWGIPIHMDQQTIGPENPFFDPNYKLFNLANETRGVYSPLRPKKTEVGCVPEAMPMQCSGQMKRLRYDPLCRSIGAQVSDALEDFMKQNPYMIVQVGSDPRN